VSSGTPGRIPPKWDDYILWQKSIFLEARRKFELEGRTARSLEELGYFYDPSEFNVEGLDSVGSPVTRSTVTYSWNANCVS
jgi:hypothetical protein